MSKDFDVGPLEGRQNQIERQVSAYTRRFELCKVEGDMSSLLNLLLYFHLINATQASQAESIECKNEMDPFPHLIDLIFTEQMYLY